jgi:hypothetical protein
MILDSFRKDSVSGHILYSLPQGIEVICENEKEHGILEVRSKASAHYRVSRGGHTIVLWNNPPITNPLESDKKFRKEKNRLEKHIASVFEATGNGSFSIDNSQCEVKTNTTNPCQVSSYIPNFCKPIVFQPFVFFKDGARSGGARISRCRRPCLLKARKQLIWSATYPSRKLSLGYVCVQTS